MLGPRLTWLAFGACLAVVALVMGWLTVTVLRLDHAEAEAGRQALVEENIRLALWRMDSAMGPLIAAESARPYFVYTTLHAPLLAYTRDLAPLGAGLRKEQHHRGDHEQKVDHHPEGSGRGAISHAGAPPFAWRVAPDRTHG